MRVLKTIGLMLLFFIAFAIGTLLEVANYDR